MNITDIRMKKITREGKLKAVASITLDDAFAIHDIKVIDGEKGMFIAMPSRKTAEGEYKDIAHPISQEARSTVQKLILDEYDRIKDLDEE